MNEERYKQIKDSIELQSLVKKQMGVEDELLQEEIELLKAYEKLQQENQSLKKQLEEYKHKGLYNTCLPYSTGYKKAIKEKENQQKEFINYLEDEIKRINPKELNIGELNLRLNDIKFTQYLIYKEILRKYKEIIGDDK